MDDTWRRALGALISSPFAARHLAAVPGYVATSEKYAAGTLAARVPTIKVVNKEAAAALKAEYGPSSHKSKSKIVQSNRPIKKLTKTRI